MKKNCKRKFLKFKVENKKTKNCIFGERMKKKFNKMWKNDLFKKKLLEFLFLLDYKFFNRKLFTDSYELNR